MPFPGNCHDYYVCFEDGNGSGNFHVQVFNCGETWVYDPNTGSCTWPEEAADDLCKYWYVSMSIVLSDNEFHKCEFVYSCIYKYNITSRQASQLSDLKLL